MKGEGEVELSENPGKVLVNLVLGQSGRANEDGGKDLVFTGG